MSRRRLVILAAAAGATVALGAGGLAATGELRSPDQVAADASPPEPSLLTAEIEERVLADELVFRGSVVTGGSRSVPVPPAGEGAAQVLTGVPVAAGDELAEGQVLAELSGRPLFLLQGAFPAYRDLAGGDSGPDVRQLQEALRRLGHLGSVDGELGPGTQDAIGALYRDRGYDAPPGDPQAREQVAAAQDTVEQAETGLASARRSPDGDVEAAREALDRAEGELADLRLAAGPSLPLAEVAYVDTLPATLDSLGGGVGARLGGESGPLAQLSTGDRMLEVQVPPDLVGALEVDDRAEALHESTGETIGLVVESISDEATRTGPSGAGGDEASDAPRHTVRLRPTGGQLPQDAEGTLRVTIGAQRSREPVLAVPVSGVYSRAGGDRFVTVDRGDGADRDSGGDGDGGLVDVTVTTGRSVGGWVEITGSDGPGADLVEAGAEVVVGLGSAPAPESAGES